MVVMVGMTAVCVVEVAIDGTHVSVRAGGETGALGSPLPAACLLFGDGPGLIGRLCALVYASVWRIVKRLLRLDRSSTRIYESIVEQLWRCSCSATLKSSIPFEQYLLY